jgi:hypothetical protein
MEGKFLPPLQIMRFIDDMPLQCWLGLTIVAKASKACHWQLLSAIDISLPL